MMLKLKLLDKWALLVSLNSAVGVYVAIDPSLVITNLAISGIVFGIITFITLYTLIDYHLLQKGKVSFREWLFIGATLKAFTQLFPVIEILSGFAAFSLLELFNDITGVYRHPQDSFIATYFMTIVAGYFYQ